MIKFAEFDLNSADNQKVLIVLLFVLIISTIYLVKSILNQRIVIDEKDTIAENNHITLLIQTLAKGNDKVELLAEQVKEHIIKTDNNNEKFVQILESIRGIHNRMNEIQVDIAKLQERKCKMDGEK
jgi:hypothetical protein